MNPSMPLDELTGEESDLALAEKLKAVENELLDTKIIYRPSIFGILGFIILFTMLGCMLGLAIQIYLNNAPITVAFFATEIFTLGGFAVGFMLAMWRVITKENRSNSQKRMHRQFLNSQIQKIRQEIDRRAES